MRIEVSNIGRFAFNGTCETCSKAYVSSYYALGLFSLTVPNAGIKAASTAKAPPVADAGDAVPRDDAMDEDLTTATAAVDDDIIPWKISNRYYTADVHFKLIELTQWSPLEVENVPAVVYAWSIDQVRLVYWT